jgi:hypothetical protein
MITYYWESEESFGNFVAENDEAAINNAFDIPKLMVIYKEFDSEDGTPFIIVWEQSSE